MIWDDEAGYDTGDPKHPDYADAMADKADRVMDEMKADGTWPRYSKWVLDQAAAGLTGQSLTLAEWRRQQAEDEAGSA